MAQITLNSTGVASNGSLVLQSNGTTAAVTVDASQNVGVGVTPSAWNTGGRAIEVRNGGNALYSTGTNTLYQLSNAFLNSAGDFKYSSTNFATQYTQYNGTHSWHYAPSGTAGNTVTFTQAMTLDASGNLGIGTTSPSQRLHLNIGSATAIYNRIQNSAGDCYLGLDTSGNTNLSADNTGNQLIFKTQAIERARIDSSGNLLVGTTSTLGSTAGIYVANSGANVQALTTNSTSGSAYYIGRFYSGGVEKGYIYFDGTNVSYTNLSDYRLKENVQPMQNALDKVAQLNPVTYNWKSNGKAGQGFIAHELQAVIPDCVTGEKDEVNEDGSIKPQGVDTSFLVATLTAAIQEQNQLITQLTARITALEGA